MRPPRVSRAYWNKDVLLAASTVLCVLAQILCSMWSFGDPGCSCDSVFLLWQTLVLLKHHQTELTYGLHTPQGRLASVCREVLGRRGDKHRH